MKQKQKHKNRNITSFELQLIKNYYNFNKTTIINKNKISFVCYGSINVLENQQRACFNDFALANNITLDFTYLSSKSIQANRLFSSINSIKYIINSGIYQIRITFKKKPIDFCFKLRLNNHNFFLNKLKELDTFVTTNEINITFNPSVIKTRNSSVLIRSTNLKKQKSHTINLQLISYLRFLKNKNKSVAE
jgi:hypothetical protein